MLFVGVPVKVINPYRELNMLDIGPRIVFLYTACTPRFPQIIYANIRKHHKSLFNHIDGIVISFIRLAKFAIVDYQVSGLVCYFLSITLKNVTVQ